MFRWGKRWMGNAAWACEWGGGCHCVLRVVELVGGTALAAMVVCSSWVYGEVLQWHGRGLVNVR